MQLSYKVIKPRFKRQFLERQLLWTVCKLLFYQFITISPPDPQFQSFWPRGSSDWTGWWVTLRKYECIACQRDSLFRGCVGLLAGPWEAGEACTLSLWTTMAGRTTTILRRLWSTPDPSSTAIIHSFCQKPESASMAAQSGAKFQPLPSAYVDQPKNLCCSKHGCSYFPVSVFISWFWQVTNPAWCCWLQKSNATFQTFFFVLLPWMVAFQAKFPPFIALGSIFLIIIMGLLPAMMLRQGVTQGRPARFTKYRWSECAI